MAGTERGEVRVQATTPPEVLFDRWLREHGPRRKDLPRNHPDSRIYRGKKDLDQIEHEGLRSMLVAVQDGFNEALRGEDLAVPHHVSHPPFHFDYIDSDSPNAEAFRYRGHSFIGVSMAMIYLLADICLRLSSSQTVTKLLGLEFTAEEALEFYAMLFQSLLSFVIAHEYTHHVHGDVVESESDPTVLSGILNDAEATNLDSQVSEAAADGYAVYHLLANLINGPSRIPAVKVLKCSDKPPDIQSKLIFACFVVVVGAYLFARPPVSADAIYQSRHPPQAARMNLIMHHATGWCKQNRSDLEAWATIDRFQALMRAAAEATWEMNGGVSWDAQTAFFKSGAGVEYFAKIDTLLKARMASL